LNSLGKKFVEFPAFVLSDVLKNAPRSFVTIPLQGEVNKMSFQFNRRDFGRMGVGSLITLLLTQ
jgi:hypothetical protein